MKSPDNCEGEYRRRNRSSFVAVTAIVVAKKTEGHLKEEFEEAE